MCLGGRKDRMRRFPQTGREENESFVATSVLKTKTRTFLLNIIQCLIRVRFGALHQNTVFGYAVSGSEGEVRDNNIHCGLIRDSDLNTTLKSFKKLKSIGVKNENCNSEGELFDASAWERRVLKEEKGSEKSDEDMEFTQVTERVLPLESERAKMLSVDPDALAQPDTVREEKGLPRVQLLSADEMCEEKEKVSVDVIKETAKEDINPVILSKEPVNLDDDEIEEVKHRNPARSRETYSETAFYPTIWCYEKATNNAKKGIFDVKDAPCPGRPVVKNVDKITEIIEVDRHVSSRSITQELKIDHKTVLNHLLKVGFKKKLDVWVPHQLT
ncbi:uncharacterized protein TNCV_161911 [Trichonephila clavipes]|nr:uncharacterized protein TNCV_161911 [Trichonephila clavipes]